MAQNQAVPQEMERAQPGRGFVNLRILVEVGYTGICPWGLATAPGGLPRGLGPSKRLR